MAGKVVFEWVTFEGVSERYKGGGSGQGSWTGMHLMYSENRKQTCEALGLLEGHTTLVSVSLFAVACPFVPWDEHGGQHWPCIIRSSSVHFHPLFFQERESNWPR